MQGLLFENEQTNSSHKFPYKWTLKDTIFTKDKGNVFSCFACGGGSTMGYKLAGFDVLGCNEIDAKMMACYIENHHPQYAYLEPIQTFKLRDDLPKELYNLDILDGSPPCSSFSMAGNREKDWGKDKVFREGQAMQILDTLFFDFIDLAEKLQPKIVMAENVKGLIMGGARKYLKAIYKAFDKAGFTCECHLLNASKMGVPQRRERVFFICMRKDLEKEKMPKLDLRFNENAIKYKEYALYNGGNISEYALRAWSARKPTDKSIADSKKHVPGMKVSDMNTGYVFENKVVQTLSSKGLHGCLLYSLPIRLSNDELKIIGTFPSDYNFLNNIPGYLIGMSVPPIMTAQIATRIYDQWLKPLNK